MQGTDRRLAMAYAFGVLNGTKDRVKLGSVNSEWSEFTLTIADRSKYGNTNSTYSLYCESGLGEELAFSRIITVYEGLDLDHIIHLLMQAMDCYESEKKKAT